MSLTLDSIDQLETPNAATWITIKLVHTDHDAGELEHAESRKEYSAKCKNHHQNQQ